VESSSYVFLNPGRLEKAGDRKSVMPMGGASTAPRGVLPEAYSPTASNVDTRAVIVLGHVRKW
jgi:hypothetical protein